MTIITLRTEKPEAELALLEGQTVLEHVSWQAHRQLAETLHNRINDLLQHNNKDWRDIDGIVCYEGPGSFTGLRIGCSVANALSLSLGIPVVGTTGDNWIVEGAQQIELGKVGQKPIIPEYGAPVHITQQRK